MPASVGALLARPDLIERAGETGARILVPTGALLGLDAVRAAAEGEIRSVIMETRKPPSGLAGAPYLEERGISLDGLTEPSGSSPAAPATGLGAFPPMSTSPPPSASPASAPSAPVSRSGPIRASPATPT